MKKGFRNYLIIWAILFLLFDCVVFIVRPHLPSYVVQYDARFWVVWLLIKASFIGTLVCAYNAFKAENLKKMFYNLPLITITWSALIAQLVCGAILLLIPNCPAWIAGLVCLLIFAFTAIAVVKASWAAEVIQAVDEKIDVKTAFLRNAIVDAEGVMARAKDGTIKADCKKVYEALRYSDPMSSPELSVIEAKITVKLDELRAAVEANDVSKVTEVSDELVLLVGDRNRKCKTLK